MEISIDELRVPTRILPPPRLTAKKEVSVTPGVINFKSGSFYKTSQIKTWTVVNTYERNRQQDLLQFAKVFRTQGASTGVMLHEPLLVNGEFPTISDRMSLEQFERKLEEFGMLSTISPVLFIYSYVFPSGENTVKGDQHVNAFLFERPTLTLYVFIINFFFSSFS